MGSLKEEKQKLRMFHMNKRKKMNFYMKEKKDLKIFNYCKRLSFLKTAEIVLCYVSVNLEVDTIRIIKHCFNNKKKVAVPVCCLKNNNMDFYYVNSLKELKFKNNFLLEPYAKQENLFSNSNFLKVICFVPGFVYDFFGNRIGYGKGYYDRFLKRVDCLKIGLCYDFNLEEKIKVNCFDVPVDYILTDKHILKML